MEYLPDHYEDLGGSRTASQQEIERAHAARVAQMRDSNAADAEEELEEIEAAYSVLRNLEARTAYDQRLREKEEREDKGFVELDARIPRRHRRTGTRGSSGLLDAAWSALGLIFKRR